MCSSDLDTAVGGEEFLELDNAPVVFGSDVLTSSVRGALVRGQEYRINPANGRLKFVPALVSAEEITADYSHYTGLIAEVQAVIDGLLNDRINFPGFRAAGALCQVRAPTIIVQPWDVTITTLPGYDRAVVRALVRVVLASYVQGLSIGDDIIVSEGVERAMSVPGMYDIRVDVPTRNVPMLDNQRGSSPDAQITVR